MLVRNQRTEINKHLSEQQLAAIGLNYLRGHYNNYLHQLSVIIEPEQKAFQGIIIDGSLTIPLPNGNKHVATIEASDLEKKNEVTYVILRRKKWMDAFAFGSVMTFFWLLLDHIFDIFFHHITDGFWSKLAAATGLLLFFMLFYYIVFGKRLRYYYIYAVEQFKRYFADDQWIILSGALWNYLDFDDRNMLKRQCVKYGLGLLKAEEDGTVEMLIDAAKYDVLEGTRKNKFKKYIQHWEKPLKSQNKKLAYRFIPNDIRTFIIGAVSLTATLLLVLYEGYEAQKQIYVQEDRYEKHLQSLSYGPEADYFYLDAQYYPYQNIQMPQYKETLSDMSKNLFVSNWNKILLYDCHRINMQEAPFYILQIDWFENKTALLQQMKLYQNKKIILNGLWMGCRYDYADYYVMFTGPFFTSFEQATASVPAVKEILLKNGISFKKLTVVEITQ